MLESPLVAVDPEVRDAVLRVAAALEALGHRVEPGPSLAVGAGEEFIPLMARTAPRVGAFRDLDGPRAFAAASVLGAFTAPFNCSRQPAASVPAGLS